MNRITLQKLSAGVGLACLLGAGASSAQNTTQTRDEPQNPHSTENKDRAAEEAPAKTTAEETQAAEQGNPHSTLNAAKPNPSAKGDAAETNAQVRRSERGNPDSIDNAAGAMMTPAVLVQRLHVANLAEIEAGKLAEANGTPRAADYGRMLVADHTKADRKLTELTGKMKMNLDEEPSDKLAKADQAEAKKTAAKLQPLHGAAFDKEFSLAMESGHKKVISLIESTQDNVTDPELSAMLTASLPTLKHHQTMAHDLRAPMAQGRAVH